MRSWIPAGVVALAAAIALAQEKPPPAEVDALLEKIVKVGREGAGNVEAARAWKALVGQGTPALIPILARMSDTDESANNWLRPAFEAIAEKSLKDNKALPKAELEKFLAQRTNPPAGRRLAYEWLVKIDPTAPDRYLARGLNDPSPEMRRDAVERIVREAERLLQKKDDQAARRSYERALAGACDPDQVDAIAGALDKLGMKVDLLAHLGVVSKWHLMAPFDHADGVGWDRAYPPEQGVDLKATYKGKGGVAVKWVAHETRDPHGVVDLNKALAKHKGAVAYAVAFIDSPTARAVQLRAGCICGLKIFLNGKPAFAREEYHHGMRIDQYTARVNLKAGRNTILLKVCQNEQTEDWAQAWSFQLRICDSVGAAVPFTQGPVKTERGEKKP